MPNGQDFATFNIPQSIVAAAATAPDQGPPGGAAVLGRQVRLLPVSGGGVQRDGAARRQEPRAVVVHALLPGQAPGGKEGRPRSTARQQGARGDVEGPQRRGAQALDGKGGADQGVRCDTGYAAQTLRNKIIGPLWSCPASAAAAAAMQECLRAGQDARGALCQSASTGASKRGARTAAEAAFVRMHDRGGPAKTAGGAASASICGNGDGARSAGGASCAHMTDSVACATIAAAAASASTSDNEHSVKL
jgi:hypothetical protein